MVAFRFETAQERLADNVIQFPNRMQEEPIDKQLMVELYNRCAQIEKNLRDTFEDPKFDTLTDEQIMEIHNKARSLVWNSSIQFS